MTEQQPSQQQQGMFGSLFAKKPDAPESSGGLFSKKVEPDHSAELTNMASILNETSRRLIVVEERYNDLRRKSQVTEENMIGDFKKVHIEVQNANDEILDIRHAIDEIKGKILLVIKELKLTARKEDTEVIQKYLKLWEPINFVTQNEVEKLVADIVEEKFSDLNIKLEQENFIQEQVKKAIVKIRKK